MKKFWKIFVVTFVMIVVAVAMTGCKVGSVTTVSSGNTCRIYDDKEVIYDGPTEFVDEDYEKEKLMKSEYNWTYDWKTQEFTKTPRHGTVFDE